MNSLSTHRHNCGNQKEDHKHNVVGEFVKHKQTRWQQSERGPQTQHSKRIPEIQVDSMATVRQDHEHYVADEHLKYKQTQWWQSERGPQTLVMKMNP